MARGVPSHARALAGAGGQEGAKDCVHAFVDQKPNTTRFVGLYDKQKLSRKLQSWSQKVCYDEMSPSQQSSYNDHR